MYLCPIKENCAQSFNSIPELLNHLRHYHNGWNLTNITCTFCDNCYTFDSFRKHLKERHDPPTIANEEHEFDNDYGNAEAGDDIVEEEIGGLNDINDENEEREFVIFQQNEGPEIQDNSTPMNKMKAALKRFSEGILEKSLNFSKHPDVTEKSASFCCNLFLEITEEITDVFKPFLEPEILNSIKVSLKNDLLPMTSTYRRKQHIEKLGLLISPKMYTVNYEHYTAGSVDGLQLKERRQAIAMFSIKDTLLTVLQNSEIADALVMPSDFRASEKLNHPFCCSRAQKIYNDIGEDYLALELNLDEYATTCPIGTTTSIYKMVGCYIKLLNFPQDLLSKLDHIFSCFVAHSSDIMGDLQQQLEKTLIVELRQLETDGIYFNYRGNMRKLKVILLSLVADNLGIHQLKGLTICFSGNNPCRMCRVTAVNLKGQNELDMNAQKTAEAYDRLIADGNVDEMRNYGIDVPCAFNQLNYFHCMKNVTVDQMHDLLEGHLHIVIPMVIRDAIAQGITLITINNAIKNFGFIGSDNENPPRPILLPARVPDSGDSFKQTAHTTHVLVKLLPLIFYFAGIRLRTPIWTMFMKLQRIIDILWAHEIDEATVLLLEQLIKNYLAQFHANGGNMTVKAHLMLHYPRIIREMGPLQFLSSIRFEAKHRNFKAYASSNRCHKNVPLTLAIKSAIIFASTLYHMKSGTYLSDIRRSRAQKKLKRGLAVVYNQNATTKEPVFGKIQSLIENILNLQCLNVLEFHEPSHCFKVTEAADSIQIPVDTLLCPEPLPIYCRTEKFIRMNYSLL